MISSIPPSPPIVSIALPNPVHPDKEGITVEPVVINGDPPRSIPLVGPGSASSSSPALIKRGSIILARSEMDEDMVVVEFTFTFISFSPCAPASVIADIDVGKSGTIPAFPSTSSPTTSLA
jgi:hypothetical protein